MLGRRFVLYLVHKIKIQAVYSVPVGMVLESCSAAQNIIVMFTVRVVLLLHLVQIFRTLYDIICNGKDEFRQTLRSHSCRSLIF